MTMMKDKALKIISRRRRMPWQPLNGPHMILQKSKKQDAKVSTRTSCTCLYFTSNCEHLIACSANVNFSWWDRVKFYMTGSQHLHNYPNFLLSELLFLQTMHCFHHDLPVRLFAYCYYYYHLKPLDFSFFCACNLPWKSKVEETLKFFCHSCLHLWLTLSMIYSEAKNVQDATSADWFLSPDQIIF